MPNARQHVDAQILPNVESTLATAQELHLWLRDRIAAGGPAGIETFMQDFDASEPVADQGRLFYDTFSSRGSTIPVTGVLQEMFFDRARPDVDLDWYQNQLREFVLGYFLRVTKVRQPVALGTTVKDAPDDPLAHPETLEGAGFMQWLCKDTATGQIRELDGGPTTEVGDLRNLGVTQDWVVVATRFYGFDMTLDVKGISVGIPMQPQAYNLLDKSLVIDEDRPEPGVLGRYGCCFAMPRVLPDPPPVFEYGPGMFDPCIHRFCFELLEDGTIRSTGRLVCNQPVDVLNFKSHPVLDALYKAGHFVADHTQALGLTTDRLFRKLLALHFETDYQLQVQVARNWRRVPDWTKDIPEWARTGVI